MGTLFVVATPIGNLGDITLRGLETLRAVTHIAAEDTRRTRALLTHFEIQKKHLLSLDAHASPRKIEELVLLLEGGEDVAFVTDAGTPSLSDPGTHLVQAARARGQTVIPIPGPSALTAAIAASGLVEGAFFFAGFLPRHGKKRRDALERIARSEEPCILFESPQRTAATLAELAQAAPERRVAVCRELTKLHEEISSGTLAEVSGTERTWRGEVTIVLGTGTGELETDPKPDRDALEARIRERFRGGASVKTLVAELGPETSLPRRELYSLVQRLREAENTER
jgi:16S rRNA (cytidine1402-2'-O)-methyltransferase